MASQQTTRRTWAKIAVNKPATKSASTTAVTRTTVALAAKKAFTPGGGSVRAPAFVAALPPSASTTPSLTSVSTTASHNFNDDTGSSRNIKEEDAEKSVGENNSSSSISNNAASNDDESSSKNNTKAEEPDETTTAQDTDVIVVEDVPVSPSLTAVASPAISISTTTTIAVSPIIDKFLAAPEFTPPTTISPPKSLDPFAPAFQPSVNSKLVAKPASIALLASTPEAEAQKAEAGSFKLNAAAPEFSPIGLDATAKSFIPSAPVHYICNKTTLSRLDSSSPPPPPSSCPSDYASSPVPGDDESTSSSKIILINGINRDRQVTCHGDHTLATTTANAVYISPSSSASPVSTSSRPLDPEAMHFMPPNYSDYWDEIYKRREYNERLLSEHSSSKTDDHGDRSDEADDEQQQQLACLSGTSSPCFAGHEWERLQPQQQQQQQEQGQQSQQEEEEEEEQQVRKGHWNSKTEQMAEDECFRIHLKFGLDKITIARRVNGIQDKQAEQELRDDIRRIFNRELHRCFTWRLNACRGLDDETCDMICGSELPELVTEEPAKFENGLVARIIGPDEDYEDIMEEMYTTNRPKYRWRPPYVPRCERIQRGIDNCLTDAMSSIGPIVAWWASVNKDWFDEQTVAIRAHILNQDALERPLNGNGATLEVRQLAWKRIR